MAVERMRVRLADIVPSKSNPRRDFGDLDALAAAIESTGGEPVNPPVLVADGNIYRIVDGERRYRALRKLHGDDAEVTALVYDSMDEANEVVAMLATDDKRPLTEAERAHGVQQMLLLGVDTERVAKIARAVVMPPLLQGLRHGVPVRVGAHGGDAREAPVGGRAPARGGRVA